MVDGFILLQRGLQHHPFYPMNRPKDKAFCAFSAWVDILFEVQFMPESQQLMGNEVVTVKRGEIIRSVQAWADRWKWSHSAVRRYFKLCQKMGLIEIKTVWNATHLRVIDYDASQSFKRVRDEHLHTGTSSVRHETVKRSTRTSNAKQAGYSIPWRASGEHLASIWRASGEHLTSTRNEGNTRNARNAREEGNSPPPNPPPPTDSPRRGALAAIHVQAVEQAVIPGHLQTAEFQAAWTRFHEEQAVRLKYLTPNAVAEIMDRLSVHPVGLAIAAIRKSISNRWPGVYPEEVIAKDPEFQAIAEPDNDDIDHWSLTL